MSGIKIARGVAAVAALALALALCWGAVDICLDGLAVRRAGDAAAPIFSAEAIAARASAVAPVFLAWLAATAGAAIYIRARGGKRPARRAASASRARSGAPDPGETPAGRRRAALRIALYAAAAALIALGIANGGMNDVLVKAVNICTECIGLG